MPAADRINWCGVTIDMPAMEGMLLSCATLLGTTHNHRRTGAAKASQAGRHFLKTTLWNVPRVLF
jgi:hypothetical protein